MIAIKLLNYFLQYYIVSDIAIFVLKRDIKLQLTNSFSTMALLVVWQEGHLARGKT